MKSSASHREHTELVIGRLYTPVKAYWIFDDIWRAAHSEYQASFGQTLHWNAAVQQGQGGRLPTNSSILEPATPILLLGIEIDHFKILVEDKIWFLNSNALLNHIHS